jgi:PAS domain-containing protein
MRRFFRIKLRIRRFTRHHPWLTGAVRSFMIFSAAFGGAYGFITGSRSEQSGYDPHAFAIGASFLFALACVGLATLSIRLRWMRKKLRKIALHNEALADRNWELQEAEQRARSLFESQGDLIVLRDAAGAISFVNDAYCELVGQPRSALVGSRFTEPAQCRLQLREEFPRRRWKERCRSKLARLPLSQNQWLCWSRTHSQPAVLPNQARLRPVPLRMPVCHSRKKE